MCDDGIDYDWKCNNGPPKDLVTLIRNTIIFKFSFNGFLHCR